MMPHQPDKFAELWGRGVGDRRLGHFFPSFKKSVSIGDFRNVFKLHAYSVNKRLFSTTAKLVRGLSDVATTNVCKVDTSNRNHIERSRWMKWLITGLRQKKYPLIWIHYESPLFSRHGKEYEDILVHDGLLWRAREWGKKRTQRGGGGVWTSETPPGYAAEYRSITNRTLYLLVWHAAIISRWLPMGLK